MGSGDIDMANCVVIGGQALQQVRGMQAKSVHLDSEDALWQAKDVTICDSTLQGRRLGWYSEGMTLINCQIMGGQPFCHCKGLKLIDCVMSGADGAFEDSEIDATLRGKVDSTWVPVSGAVVADIIGEVLRKDGHRCEGRLLVRHSDGTEEDITDRRPSPSA